MNYLILNFKTYLQASGENATKLAEIVAAVSNNSPVQLVICPQAADIYRIREKFPNLKIWAQHMDPISPGRHTGWTSPTTLLMSGANGTLINHSEHKLENVDEIKSTIETCKQYQLLSCVALNDTKLINELKSSSPDIIAFEPQELIGGSNSILDLDPQRAIEFIAQAQNSGSSLVLGAGVRDKQDISTALSLGFQGVLIASGFVTATDPTNYLQSLLEVFA